MTESEAPVEVKTILIVEDDDVEMFLTQAIMISAHLPEHEIEARKMIGLHKALDLHEPLRTIKCSKPIPGDY